MDREYFNADGLASRVDERLNLERGSLSESRISKLSPPLRHNHSYERWAEPTETPKAGRVVVDPTTGGASVPERHEIQTPDRHGSTPRIPGLHRQRHGAARITMSDLYDFHSERCLLRLCSF